MTRLSLVLACLALGCGSDLSPSPATPSPVPSPTTPVAPSIPPSSPSPTFTLSGRMTDASSGGPVEGVIVYVNPASMPPGGFWPQPTLKLVASDADGNYRVSGLPDWGV